LLLQITAGLRLLDMLLLQCRHLLLLLLLAV
jgi:hypothetical protein